MAFPHYPCEIASFGHALINMIRLTSKESRVAGVAFTLSIGKYSQSHDVCSNQAERPA